MNQNHVSQTNKIGLGYWLTREYLCAFMPIYEATKLLTSDIFNVDQFPSISGLSKWVLDHIKVIVKIPCFIHMFHVYHETPYRVSDQGCNSLVMLNAGHQRNPSIMILSLLQTTVHKPLILSPWNNITPFNFDFFEFCLMCYCIIFISSSTLSSYTEYKIYI